MGVTLRAAVPGDHAGVVAVVDDWWGRSMAGLVPRLFLDHFHRTSLIAEDDHGMAGFLIGFLSPSETDTAYVHFVGVAPRHRGAGLGRLMYERFFATASAGGRTYVTAITSPVNTGSVAFHTAMGFTVDGPVADYDGPGVDRMTFRLRLEAPPAGHN